MLKTFIIASSLLFLTLGTYAADDQAIKLGNDAMLLIQDGKMEEGLAKLKEAVQIAPNDPAGHMNYASILFLKGQKVYQSGDEEGGRTIFKEAEKELLTAIKLFGPRENDPLLSHCYFLLGDIYRYPYKREAQAKVYYQKAIEIYSQHGGAIEALKVLRK